MFRAYCSAGTTVLDANAHAFQKITKSPPDFLLLEAKRSPVENLDRPSMHTKTSAKCESCVPSYLDHDGLLCLVYFSGGDNDL